MKIKISEATPLQLDYIVSTTLGTGTYWQSHEFMASFSPTTDWAHGGPIIEREGISLVQEGDSSPWVGSVYDYTAQDWHKHTPGPTPLIAAMRCYVASKLGDEVEVPEGLL